MKHFTKKYVFSFPLKLATVSPDLMSRGRAFQNFGTAYVRERSPRVTLDNDQVLHLGLF